MNNDLPKSIRKAMDKKGQAPASDPVGRGKGKALPKQASFTRQSNSIKQSGFAEQSNFANQTSSAEQSSIAQQSIVAEDDPLNKHKQRDKPLKVFGWFCIAIFAVALIFSPTSTVNTSDAAKNALVNKVSTSLPAGTVLLSSDENIGQKDYTIAHNYGQESTKIWVWDYAAEDGDYVQVLVNGAPAGDPFMIKHKPVEITVPAVGTVQIKGIRDGGGGITYAVRYDLNGTNYYNSAPEGEFNTYTLIRAC